MALQEILWTLQNFPRGWQNILDVLLVALVFFLILRLVRGTRAATLLRGILILLVVVFTLSAVLNLQAFSWLLRNSLTALIIAVPVIFQDDIRRWLDRLGRVGLFDTGEGLEEAKRHYLIAEIVDAVRLLARQRYGALIVLERDTGLQEYMDTGVMMESLVSSALLQTAFFPRTPLHDGALIIRGDRAMAAACTLPVSGVRHMPDRTMGLRHRAALGLTEISDAIVIVISEETGKISVVDGGRFYKVLDTDRLAIILGEYIKVPQLNTAGRLLARLRQYVYRQPEGS